jgi:hypothetical protein
MANPTVPAKSNTIDYDNMHIECEGLVVNGAAMLQAQGSHIADLAAITGGEAPSEAEHNLIVTKVNAILAALEDAGILADS